MSFSHLDVTAYFPLAMADLDLLPRALLAALAFGLAGIALLVLGFKIFDWLMPKVDVEKELSERNIAVAIVMAAAILGISAVIVAAIL